MEITHAKVVLQAILEGCEDQAIIKELIDTAWRLIREEPEEEEPVSKLRKLPVKNGRMAVTVNGRLFKSVTSACKFYGMEDRYKIVLDDLRKGVHSEDIFPKEAPVKKTLRNTDPRTGLILPN